MEEEVQKKRGQRRITPLIITASIVAIVIVFLNADYLKKREEIGRIRKEFETSFPDLFCERIEKLPYEGELLVTATSSWGKPENKEQYGDYVPTYEWTDLFTVTLQVDDSFDRLTDQEKNKAIQQLETRCNIAYTEVIHKDSPLLSKYNSDWRIYLYHDKTAYRSIKHIYRIQSPDHTYRPAGTDGFYQDDQKIIVPAEEEKEAGQSGTAGSGKEAGQSGIGNAGSQNNKATVTPRPASSTNRKSSQNTKREDPYEAHLFDDPDDYADYYAEEFAEEIMENHEEGYLEAYDHWLDWYEENGSD